MTSEHIELPHDILYPGDHFLSHFTFLPSSVLTKHAGMPSLGVSGMSSLVVFVL